MKKRLPLSASIILLFLLLTASGKLFSQTSGTLSFSVTTVAPAAATSYGTNNLLAIWIEDNSTAFIKTKIKYSSTGNYDHLGTWTAKSGQNTTDATTGATRTNYGVITFLWDAKNVNGASNGILVPDGIYNIWLELAYDRLTVANEGKAVNSYSFTKGPAAVHLTPANVTNFSSVIIDWTPLITGVEGTLESKDFNVYPNPSTGLLKIDFKQPAADCSVKIINNTGQVVYTEELTDIQEGTRTLDLTSLNAGNYLCVLHFPGKDIVFSVILVK
jgi:flagellar hook assembly protein FlgD